LEPILEPDFRYTSRAAASVKIGSEGVPDLIYNQCLGVSGFIKKSYEEIQKTKFRFLQQVRSFNAKI